MTEKINKTENKAFIDYAKVTGYIALLLSLCGLMNQYALLADFGVSLSDYADLDDFLVAAINFLSREGYIPYSSCFYV